MSDIRFKSLVISASAGIIVVTALVAAGRVVAAEPTIEKRLAQRAARDQRFGREVFETLKSNDPSAFMRLLPRPPFVYAWSDGKEKRTLTVDAKLFAEFEERLGKAFKSMIAELAAEGVQPDQISLGKITVGANSHVTVVDDHFPVNIWLLLNTPRKQYRIRIEDCIIVGESYMPENLKWCWEQFSRPEAFVGIWKVEAANTYFQIVERTDGVLTYVEGFMKQGGAFSWEGPSTGLRSVDGLAQGDFSRVLAPGRYETASITLKSVSNNELLWTEKTKTGGYSRTLVRTQ